MKSKLNIIIVIWFLSMFFSGFAQERIVPPRGSEPIETYKKKVLESGDVDAYKDLYFALHRKGRVHEYFIYSLFMANKYNYPDAYFWVSKQLFDLFEDNNLQFDEGSLKMALEYLQKGVELNSMNAELSMSKIYLEGKYLPQDTVLGIQLHLKAWNVKDSASIERNLKYIRKKYINNQSND